MSDAVLRNALFPLFLVCSLAMQAGGTEIYVPDDYPAIQGAIDAAQSGDTVIVRPGTYAEWIDFLGKAITVKSSHGPLVTTIRHSSPYNARAVVKFGSGEDRNSVLDGFTITGGRGGEYWYHMSQGGGIFCVSSPTIVNNIIRDNGDAEVGWWPEIGGGIFVWGDPLIAGNVITGNLAGSGGGIYVEGGEPNIRNNVIAGNRATSYDGGGAKLSGSLTFTGNVLTENTAAGYGGGLMLYTTSSWVGANNTIVRNRAGTAGGGIYYGYPYQTSIANSVVRDNTAPVSPDVHSNGILDAYHCNIEGGWSRGSGNIDADPLFVDPVHGDFHLRFDSPCRNAGTSGVPGLPTQDFEGDPRIAGGEVDIGADEFYPHLYYRRGFLAAPGYAADREIDVRIVGPPGTPGVTLGTSWQILEPPLQTPFGDLHLQPPLLMALPLGPIPAGGVLSLTATYPDSWVEGDRIYFQALLSGSGSNALLTNLMTLTVARPPWSPLWH